MKLSPVCSTAGFFTKSSMISFFTLEQIVTKDWPCVVVAPDLDAPKYRSMIKATS